MVSVCYSWKRKDLKMNIKNNVANDNVLAENTKQVVNGETVQTETHQEIIEAEYTEINVMKASEIDVQEHANDNIPDNPNKPNECAVVPIPSQEELFIDIDAIVDQFDLPKDQLEMICENNPKAVYIPTDSIKLQQFIRCQQGISKTAESFSKMKKLPPTAQKFFLQKAQLYAYLWLKAEARLGKELQKIATQEGFRSDLKEKEKGKEADKSKDKDKNEDKKKVKRPFKEVFEEIRTKRQILDEDYGLTYNQARDLVRLSDEVIELEMKYAIANNEVPSRRHALSFLNKESSKVEKECKDAFELDTSFSAVSHDDLLGRITEEDIPYCSIFSCIGSGEYYLKSRGFKCVLANEADEKRAEYFSFKMKELGEEDCKMFQGKFQDHFDELVDEFKKRNCQLILACPPCQIFCAQKGKGFLKDPRLDLIVWLIKFIKEVKPKYIVIENAKQFLNFSMPKDTENDGEPAKNLRTALKGKTIGQYIKDELTSENYDVNFANEDACFYGCPQSRIRSIVLASQTGVWPFPKKDDHAVLPWQVIGHLPSLEPGEGTGYDKAPLLSNKNPELASEIYNALIHTAPGCCVADNPPEYQIPGYGFFGAKCSRNSWNKPWSTIEGGSNQALGLRTIHPGRLKPDGTYSDPRCCTLRETFLLNTLPEDYTIPKKFEDKKYENFIWTVMGEIFLPRMLERIMETIPLPHRKNLIKIEPKEEKNENEEVA